MEIFFNVAHQGRFVFRTDRYRDDQTGADRAEKHLLAAFPAKDGYTVDRYARPSGWRSVQVSTPLIPCTNCGADKQPGQSCGCFDNGGQ